MLLSKFVPYYCLQYIIPRILHIMLWKNWYSVQTKSWWWAIPKNSCVFNFAIILKSWKSRKFDALKIYMFYSMSHTGEIHLLYRYCSLNMCLVQVRCTRFIPVLGLEFVRLEAWSWDVLQMYRWNVDWLIEYIDAVSNIGRYHQYPTIRSSANGSWPFLDIPLTNWGSHHSLVA